MNERNDRRGGQKSTVSCEHAVSCKVFRVGSFKNALTNTSDQIISLFAWN